MIICNFYIFLNFVDPLFPVKMNEILSETTLKQVCFLIFWFSRQLFLFLLLLGNKNLLKHHSMWKDLIESFEKRHCVVNESSWPKN